MAASASKRQRVDPHALDDDTLPAQGQSVLGKRHRIQDNSYFYNNEKAQAVMKSHPNQGNDENGNTDSKDNDIAMASDSKNDSNNDNDNMMNNNNNNNNNGNNANNGNNNNNIATNWENPPIQFVRGGWIDIQIHDENGGESQWLCGVMTKDLQDKVQVHVPRQGILTLVKTSPDLAPVGTHTEGFT